MEADVTTDDTSFPLKLFRRIVSDKIEKMELEPDDDEDELLFVDSTCEIEGVVVGIVNSGGSSVTETFG